MYLDYLWKFKNNFIYYQILLSTIIGRTKNMYLTNNYAGVHVNEMNY